MAPIRAVVVRSTQSQNNHWVLVTAIVYCVGFFVTAFLLAKDYWSSQGKLFSKATSPILKNARFKALVTVLLILMTALLWPVTLVMALLAVIAFYILYPFVEGLPGSNKKTNDLEVGQQAAANEGDPHKVQQSSIISEPPPAYTRYPVATRNGPY